MKIRRKSLAHDPPRFFVLTPEEEVIVRECVAMTRGYFEVYAFITDSIFSSGHALADARADLAALKQHAAAGELREVRDWLASPTRA